MSVKNSNDTIGNRTRDLPGCSERCCHVQKKPVYHKNSKQVWLNPVVLFLLVQISETPVSERFSAELEEYVLEMDQKGAVPLWTAV